MSNSTDIITNGDLGTVKLMIRALYGRTRDEIAERLFSRFGSLRGIFDATEAELIETGLTPRAASFFTFVSPFVRTAYLRSAPAHIRVSETAAVEFASRFFVDFDRECDYIFIAEDDGTFKHFERLNGDPVRSAIGIACRQYARDVMWIRYRPRETEVAPDAARLEQVSRAVSSLDAMGINFIDYIEYGAGENYSLRREMVCGNGNGERGRFIEYSPDDGFVKKVCEYLEAVRQQKKQ